MRATLSSGSGVLSVRFVYTGGISFGWIPRCSNFRDLDVHTWLVELCRMGARRRNCGTCYLEFGRPIHCFWGSRRSAGSGDFLRIPPPLDGTNVELALFCAAPIVIALAYATLQTRKNEKRAFTFAAGAAFLTITYFATPWISDVALVALKAPSMQSSWSRPHAAHFASYEFDVSTAFDGGYSANLVYDPDDSDTKAVVNEFVNAQMRLCRVRGERVIGHYYIVRVNC